MPFVHFPVVEIIHFLVKFRHNRPFMRLSRFLLLALVTVSAASYLGIWVTALEPGSPACTMGRWACYQGPPKTFSELIFELGAPVWLFALPLVDLTSALLLLLRPPRTYLCLFVLNFAAVFGQFPAQPDPYLYFGSGAGDHLHMFCAAMLFSLSLPMALAEQMTLYPDWDYTKILPQFMLD